MTAPTDPEPEEVRAVDPRDLPGRGLTADQLPELLPKIIT